MDLKHVLGSQNALGEGPLWSVEENTLYWVDIAGMTIHRYSPESGLVETFPVNTNVGVIGFRERGGFIAAGSNGISFWNVGNTRLDPFVDPEKDNPASRFNDGKVDRAGRFWAGTMTHEGAVSSLYQVDDSLSVKRMESGITISNGIGWSPR